MKKIKKLTSPTLAALLVAMITTMLPSCTDQGSEKKKIVYVNSYHQGFPPSDQITSGVYETLPADSFEVVSYFIDSKRNSSEDYIKRRTAEILDSIRMAKPDLLIASDDNAMKFLVVPNFQNDPIPVVFCGVNWSAAQYNLSGVNHTGILEILPVQQAFSTLKTYYPGLRNLLVLNENTTTSNKTKPILDTLLNSLGINVTQELVDDFEQWKSVYAEANTKYDAIYLQTRGAIQNWDHEEALQTINEHIRVPSVTCEDFMMPYAVLGVTQLSKEQGMVAAEKAKKILAGTDPGDIPVTKNEMVRIWINKDLAGKIDFKGDEALLSKATFVE